MDIQHDGDFMPPPKLKKGVKSFGQNPTLSLLDDQDANSPLAPDTGFQDEFTDELGSFGGSPGRAGQPTVPSDSERE